MKNYILILVLLITGCGNRHSQQVSTTQSIEIRITDSTAEQIAEETDIETLPDSTSNVSKGLNDIRFGNWTDKDWLDNDYFRTLRKYIDACYKGEIKDEVLEPYKFALKGKFTIYQAEPFIAGGLFIYFIFLDVPNKIFNTWIYSYVDENTETVVDYQVRGVKIIEEDSEFTKEEIVSIIEEHPENKLW
jgi:hypothetical protein